MTGLPPELLSAVVASPEDDGPRLVCADWLDENGRADDAAFVRAQVSVARLPPDAPQGEAEERLVAEEGRLLRRHRRRWLAAVGAGEGWTATGKWERGFLVALELTPGAPAGEDVAFLAGLSAFPLLASLDVAGVPIAAVLEVLPRLPRLTDLDVAFLGELSDQDVVRLAAFPLVTFDAINSMEPRRDLNRLQARQLENARLLPAERLADALRPHANVTTTFGGRVSLEIARHDSPIASEVETLGRLPGLAFASVPGIPEWLSQHPDLRGLSLGYPNGFDRTALAGLRELREVRVSHPSFWPTDWDALFNWLTTLPRLASLVLATGGEHVDHLARRTTALPGLRVLTLAPGVEEPRSPSFDVGRLVEYAGRLTPTVGGRPVGEKVGHWGFRWSRAADVRRVALGKPVAARGVTIAAPEWFARLAPGPAVGGEEAAAEWAEWGGGDPLDRVTPHGPAWLRLEVLPFRVREDEAARQLTGPPGSLADVRWGRPGVLVSAAGLEWAEVSGRCAFAQHRRYLWRGRGYAVRLRAEWPMGQQSCENAVTATALTLARG